jgi:hypothetical protein
MKPRKGKKKKEIKIRKTWGMNPSQQVHKDKTAYKRSDNKKLEKGDEE